MCLYYNATAVQKTMEGTPVSWGFYDFRRDLDAKYEGAVKVVAKRSR